MSALRRLHEMQQKTRPGTAAHSNEEELSLPASKRLKSSHNTIATQDTLAALIDTSTTNRKKLTAVTTNGLPSKSASKVDDTRATVTTNTDRVNIPSDAISISSDEESDEEEADSDDDGDEDLEESMPHTNGVHGTNGDQTDDIEMINGVDAQSEGDEIDNEEEDEEDDEPSFGDILKARHPDVIDVHAQLPDPHAEPPHLEPASGKGALIRPVTGHSLATVLQQALKTNDKDMLESCFHLRDLQAVRNTIQRLPSPLIGSLLSRISERIYKRPGRTGSLMIWIQWSLVAHGGYLATQPDVLRKLKALNQVVRQRAQGLQPLVQLKAKLDMLTAQIELRRGLQSQRQRADAAADEDGVLYVEGDDESGWRSDEKDTAAPIESALEPQADLEVDSEEELDDFNPVQQDDSVEEADDSQNDMLDIEAEETDDDAEDEDDENEDSDEASASESVEDIDDLEDDSSEEEKEEVVRTAPPQTLNRKR